MEMEKLEAEQADAGVEYNWSVNDNCVLKHGGNWVRCIVENVTANNGKCKVSGVVIPHEGTTFSTCLQSCRGK